MWRVCKETRKISCRNDDMKGRTRRQKSFEIHSTLSRSSCVGLTLQWTNSSSLLDTEFCHPWNVPKSLHSLRLTIKTDPQSMFEGTKSNIFWISNEKILLWLLFFAITFFLPHFISWTINFYDLESKIWALKDVEFSNHRESQENLLLDSRRQWIS